MGDFHQNCKGINLLQLPVDALILIFQYLDVDSLKTAAQVCRYFMDISSSNEIWRKWILNRIFVSSKYGLSDKRCPSFKEQYRLSLRWEKGNCKISNMFHFQKSYLPWMSFDFDQQQLYLAQGETIRRFSQKLWKQKRINQSIRYEEDELSSCIVHRGVDVTRFCVTKQYVVCGGWFGKLSWSAVSNLSFHTKHNAHSSQIRDVAMLDDVIISGSRDHTVKVWKLHPHEQFIELLDTEQVGDSILSIAVNKFFRIYAVGSGGIGGVHPLQIKDLESFTHLYYLGDSYKNGAGVLDCHFQSLHMLMSTGYDTFIRLWDIRASHSSPVKVWEEPNDNTIYCVASDNRYGFVTGSYRHGLTRVWDTRMKKCLKSYYLGGRVSSPVYSVRFTHSHLFAALAQGIYALNFR